MQSKGDLFKSLTEEKTWGKALEVLTQVEL